MIVASLRTRSVMQAVDIDPIVLETDNLYHLDAATWDETCRVATFAHSSFETAHKSLLVEPE